MRKLKIYTDGACSGNPGPGGWASVFAYSSNVKKITGYEESTTNNRMELLAVVKALEEFIMSDCGDYDVIEINSDSAYVINAINQNWIKLWQSNNWITTNYKPVKNCDLWENLLVCFSDLNWMNVKVEFNKVKGHSGNPLNEMVDELAKEQIVKNSKGGKR